MGLAYSRGGIDIYQGDCLEVMPTLEAGSVHLICTDPPYGVGKAGWDDEFPTEWISHAFRLSPRVLCMPGNAALIKAGAAFGDTYRDCVVLNAVNGMTRSKVAFGNWFPVLVAGEWKWEPRPNLIKFVVNSKEIIRHPSPKPLAAMRALLAHYSKPDWVILDPFMGSGTTLRAAKELGRRCIGIELRQEYVDIAITRLAQEAMLLEV